MRIATDEISKDPRVRPGRPDEAKAVEHRQRRMDESAFVELLNVTLIRGTPVTPATRLREELESLELVLVWALLADLGAELPAECETSVLTARDLYTHTQREAWAGAIR